MFSRVPIRSIASSTVAMALAVGGGWIAGGYAERRTLAAERAEVGQDARLHAALLQSEIARFRLLPLALSDDRDVLGAGSAAARDRLNRKLERLAKFAEASTIYLIGSDGQSLAASNWRTRTPFIGVDYRSRRYFRDARRYGEGRQYALGSVSGRPGLYFARRMPTGGVIVVKLDFARMERSWDRGSGSTFVYDGRGLVLVTSRPAWRFAAIRPMTDDRAADALRDLGSPAARVARLPIVDVGAGILSPTGGDQRFVSRSVPVEGIGWTLVQMRRFDREAAFARLVVSTATGALLLALFAIAWTLTQRRLAARRREADLSRAVAERTAELRHEAEERAAAESRAAELREDLQQANRLASLGQITASVAHETAQPITAIRTYAQTSAMLLDLGRVDDVRTNLATIAELTDRVGTITAHLRGFARKQSETTGPVPLDEVIDGVLLIHRPRTSETFIVRPERGGLSVRGDRVRLEQVMVNLLQNALQAIAGRVGGRVELTVERSDEHVRLRMRDNGPGVAPEVEERLFTPFNTSRQKGLGLGLVISQDIMVELGGWLRHLPSDEGACFEMGMLAA